MSGVNLLVLLGIVVTLLCLWGIYYLISKANWKQAKAPRVMAVIMGVIALGFIGFIAVSVAFIFSSGTFMHIRS